MNKCIMTEINRYALKPSHLYFVGRRIWWNVYCWGRDIDKTPVYIAIGGSVGIIIFSVLMYLARYLENFL